MKNILFAAFPLILVLTACQERTLAPGTFPDGSHYFRWQPGSFVEYDVLRINYNEFTAEDTLRYQLREVVAERFTPQGGGTAVSLWRYKRTAADEPWALDSVWTNRLEENRVVATENNVPFIKLSLPAYPQKQWDGHALSTLPEAGFVLDSLGFSVDTAGVASDNVMHLTLDNRYDLIGKTFHVERYADTLGLIYRQEERVRYIDELASPFYGQDSIRRGFRYWQTATSFGRE